MSIKGRSSGDQVSIKMLKCRLRVNGGHQTTDAYTTQDSDTQGTSIMKVLTLYYFKLCCHNKGILQCQRVVVVYIHDLSWTSLQSPLVHISSCLWSQCYLLVIHIPDLMEAQQEVLNLR